MQAQVTARYARDTRGWIEDALSALDEGAASPVDVGLLLVNALHALEGVEARLDD